MVRSAPSASTRSKGASEPWLRGRGMLALGLTLGACTNLLGLDKDYIAEDSPLSGTGGRSGVSGSGASGSGASGLGGVSGGGARDSSVVDSQTDPPSDSENGCNADGSTCPSGQKCCSGVCAPPAPILGCSASDCTPCPEPPTNAIAICKADQCGIECNAGHIEIDGFCVSSGSGGSDAGVGDAGQCNPRDCRSCGPFGPFPCCRNNGTCGCSWAAGSYCL